MEHVQDLPLSSLADALGEVRAEIQTLRAREAVLRQTLIDARPNGPVTGDRYEVVVREHERRVFDRDSLPGAILGDARFWMTRVTRTVATRDCTAVAVHPPRVRAAATDRDLWGRETDLVLIEDF